MLITERMIRQLISHTRPDWKIGVKFYIFPATIINKFKKSMKIY